MLKQDDAVLQCSIKGGLPVYRAFSLGSVTYAKFSKCLDRQRLCMDIFGTRINNAAFCINSCRHNMRRALQHVAFEVLQRSAVASCKSGLSGVASSQHNHSVSSC